MVIDGWQQPVGPNRIDWSPIQPTPAAAQQMLDVIAKLEGIDKKLGARECKLKAKDKAKFKAKLKRRANKK